MQIIINEPNADQFKRLAHCNDAFDLIWDIDQKIRGHLKYCENITITPDKFLEELRQDIADSNLLELWN